MGTKKIDKKKYGGKYIATKSFSSNEVVASGNDLVDVYEEAIKKGAKDPVLNYVPEEGYVCLY